jgi:hypothetical protein
VHPPAMHADRHEVHRRVSPSAVGIPFHGYVYQAQICTPRVTDTPADTATTEMDGYT